MSVVEEAVYTREENGENQWTVKTQSCFTPHSKNKLVKITNLLVNTVALTVQNPCYKCDFRNKNNSVTDKKITTDNI